MTLVEDFFGSKSVFLDRFVSFRRILFVFFQVFGSYMMCMNMYYVIFGTFFFFFFNILQLLYVTFSNDNFLSS